MNIKIEIGQLWVDNKNKEKFVIVDKLNGKDIIDNCDTVVCLYSEHSTKSEYLYLNSKTIRETAELVENPEPITEVKVKQVWKNRLSDDIIVITKITDNKAFYFSGKAVLHHLEYFLDSGEDYDIDVKCLPVLYKLAKQTEVV